MSAAWPLITALGDSLLLLPLLAVLALAGAHDWRAVVRWGVAVACTAGLVLLSKIAFLGWGLGWPALDFTGFSGHAAMAAVVYPVALHAQGKHTAPAWRRIAALLGLLLAALVAVSRLALHAHSLSEVLAGWLLGAVASVWVLWPGRATPKVAGWALWLGLALGLSVLRWAPAQWRSHHLVEQLALMVSGREHPHTRPGR